MRLAILSVSALLAIGACDKPNIPRPPADAQLTAITWDSQNQRYLSDGVPLDTVKLWRFGSDAGGFSGMNVSMAPVNEGLEVRATGSDPAIRTPADLNISGENATLVVVRLTRVAQAQSWDGSLYFSTSRDGESGSRRASPVNNDPPRLGEDQLVVYDLANPSSASRAWRRSTIAQIRFDLDNEAGGAFIIHEVAIIAR